MDAAADTLTVSLTPVCQSVKILSYLEPQTPEYQHFVQNLKTDAKNMFDFGIRDSLVLPPPPTVPPVPPSFYPPSDGPSHSSHSDLCLYQYNLIAGGFHDGVMMYAQALNETLSELGAGPGGVQRPRGDLVTRRMWNRTFSGQLLVTSHASLRVNIVDPMWEQAAPNFQPITAQGWMRTFIVFHETTESRNILTVETR